MLLDLQCSLQNAKHRKPNKESVTNIVINQRMKRDIFIANQKKEGDLKTLTLKYFWVLANEMIERRGILDRDLFFFKKIEVY